MSFASFVTSTDRLHARNCSYFMCKNRSFCLQILSTQRPMTQATNTNWLERSCMEWPLHLLWPDGNCALLPCYPFAWESTPFTQCPIAIAILLCSHSANCKPVNAICWLRARGAKTRKYRLRWVDRCVQLMLNDLRISMISNASSLCVNKEKWLQAHTAFSISKWKISSKSHA